MSARHGNQWYLNKAWREPSSRSRNTWAQPAGGLTTLERRHQEAPCQYPLPGRHHRMVVLCHLGRRGESEQSSAWIKHLTVWKPMNLTRHPPIAVSLSSWVLRHEVTKSPPCICDRVRIRRVHVLPKMFAVDAIKNPWVLCHLDDTFVKETSNLCALLFTKSSWHINLFCRLWAHQSITIRTRWHVIVTPAQVYGFACCIKQEACFLTFKSWDWNDKKMTSLTNK